MRRKKEVDVVRFRRKRAAGEAPVRKLGRLPFPRPHVPTLPPIAPSVSAHGCPGLDEFHPFPSTPTLPSSFPRTDHPGPNSPSRPSPSRHHHEIEIPFSRASNRRPHSTAPILATESSKRIPSLASARNSQRRYQNRNPPFHHITSNETTNRAAFDPSILSELGPSRAPAYFYCCHLASTKVLSPRKLSTWPF